MHSLINANNIIIVALNVYFFLNKPCAHIKKILIKHPFWCPQTRSIFNLNTHDLRIYLRLKFSGEMNGCTYKRLRSVKGLLLTFRSEQEKGDNGWHLTGVHYTFLYKWQSQWKIRFSFFFLFKKNKTHNKPYSFWNNHFHKIFI